jgi:hypothetical protein
MSEKARFEKVRVLLEQLESEIASARRILKGDPVET